MPESVRILIAGLPDRLAAWLAQRLPHAAVEVTYTGDDALDLLLEGSWSLLVVDGAVEGTGAEPLLRRMRANPRLRALPVILTLEPGEGGVPEDQLARLVEELRADRILLHPVDRGELARHAQALLAMPVAAPQPEPAPPAPLPSPSPAAVATPVTAPVEPATPAAEAAAPVPPALGAALAALWARSLPMVMDRVAAVERGVAAALRGVVPPEVRGAAEREAHRLTGALGTFGLPEGSRLARELEHAFAPGTAHGEAAAQRLAETVAALRAVIEAHGAPSSPSPPAPAPAAATPTASATPGGAPLLLVVGDAARGPLLEREAAARGLALRVAAAPSVSATPADMRPDALLLSLGTAADEDAGWPLLAEAAARFAGVPLVLAASRDSLLDRVRALQLGARVFLTEPAAPAEALDAVARLLPQAADAGRRPRVLVVDDDPQILDALRALLAAERLELHTLDSPLRFWRVLREVEPDLLVLDVEMPHLNGIELCRVVRGDLRWSRLPVVFLTARNDADTILRVFAAGADDYVAKPFVGPELVARIRGRAERLAPA